MEGFFKSLLEWALAGDRLVWVLVFGEAVVIWKLYTQGRADLIAGLKAREQIALAHLEAVKNSTATMEKMRQAVEVLHNAVTIALNMRGR